MSEPTEVPMPDPTPQRPQEDTAERSRWQRKLLPYMTRFLVAMAAIFFALSMLDVHEMRSFVKREAGDGARAQIEQLIRGADAAMFPSALVQKSLLILEADAMERRYRQANALLLSRIWTRQLSFMTGMVLAFIGAVFILGRLSEARTDVNVGNESWKAAVSSSSPGLILAFLGTLLIGTSLVVQPAIQVQDRPVYLMTMGVVDGVSSPPRRPSLDPGAVDPGLLEPNVSGK
jgi:hypothetical protein